MFHPPTELLALQINTVACVIMVFSLSLGMFILALQKKNEHLSSRWALALAAWLLNWFGMLVFYTLLIAGTHPWITMLTDAVSSVCLLGCALLLLPLREEIHYVRIAAICLSTLFLILSWTLAWRYFGDSDQAIRMLAAFPGLSVSVASFVTLAVAAAKQFTQYKAAIWMCCIIYATLQIPGYMALIIGSGEAQHQSMWTLLLAIGKVMLLITTWAILLQQLGVIAKDNAVKLIGIALAVITPLIELATAIIELASAK